MVYREPLQNLHKSQVKERIGCVNIVNLIDLHEPYIHLFTGRAQEFNNFLTKIEAIIKHEQLKIIAKRIEGLRCHNLGDVFSEFAMAFNFPNYFGYNWAAFDECLNDLSWLAAPSYILCIANFDALLFDDPTDRKILIEILSSSVKEWTQGVTYGALIRKPTAFHIIFQCAKNKEDLVKMELKKASIDEINIIVDEQKFEKQPVKAQD